jgi:hypothetical protein
VLQLGHDIASFLQEPRLSDSIQDNKNNDDLWYAAPKNWGPYAAAVHYGYLQRFKYRVVNLFNELTDQQIRLDLEPSEIDPPRAVRENLVRRIAEECFLVAARMDTGEVARDSEQARELVSS